MDVYVNICGKWTLLDETYKIDGDDPYLFIEKIFFPKNEDEYKLQAETKCLKITHMVDSKEERYAVPVSFAQLVKK